MTRAYKRQLEREYRSGSMTEEKYKEGLLAAADWRVMDKLMETVEGSPDKWGGFDWAKIATWFKENWQEILKLVISLVIMFI